MPEPMIFPRPIAAGPRQEGDVMNTYFGTLHGYMPTLVVNADGAAANQLAEQLLHSGFQTDIATSCSAAQAAARARRYGTFVVAADLNLPGDRECLRALRSRGPRVWIIVISSTSCAEADEIILECGADALLPTPFSHADLIFRLSAFSYRSRPS